MPVVAKTSFDVAQTLAESELREGGQRFDIPTTRAVVQAAISGELRDQPTETLPGFGFQIPIAANNVDASVLDPRNSWSDKSAYNEKANILIAQFIENFKQYQVTEAIKAAGPDKI